MNASCWETDALDPGWDAGTPPRAKPIIRRVAARWDEREGAFLATIDLWSVRVAKAPSPSASWEWSAFSLGLPRALRCTGFPDRESAQRDAESTIALRS
jgi:hypothetical protein